MPRLGLAREEGHADAARAAEDQRLPLEVDDALEAPHLVQPQQQELVLDLEAREVERELDALVERQRDAAELPDDARAADARGDALLARVEAVEDAERAWR